MIKKVILITFILCLSSCSQLMKKSGKSSSGKKRGSQSSRPAHYNAKLTLQDKSGKFEVVRESGMAKDKKSYVTKYRVYSVSGPGRKILEQSIVFATPGVLSDKVRLMRPHRSQYKVWFDKQLYQTETTVNPKEKSLVVKMESPEKQWSGTKKYVFPGGNGIFCYFTQAFECIKYTGFIDKAIEANAGKVSFHMIWDGFPYFHEQYLNIAPGPFAQAEMEYDGKTKEGEHRFSVSVSGNAIFYLYNENKEYVKMFWPAQGLSLYDK